MSWLWVDRGRDGTFVWCYGLPVYNADRQALVRWDEEVVSGKEDSIQSRPEVYGLHEQETGRPEN